MNPVRRLLPAPWLSATLLVTWLLLARDAGPAHLLLGLALALVIPVLSGKLRLRSGRLARPALVVGFMLRVVGDVVVSNLQVGCDVILYRKRRPASRFVTIPLDLTDSLGLSVLAIVTTVVPGTVWSELAVDRSSLLLHAWNAPDEAAFVARFKTRYETPLREIFQ